MFYKIVVGFFKFLVFIVFDIEVQNAENLNKTEGGLIACGNHISMIDPVILAISSKRQVHFMGKKELFDKKILGYVFRKLGAFPVDRQGVSMSAIKSSLAVLSNDEILGIFPEGTRVKQHDESNAKPGIALIANKAKVNILPFYIQGKYKFRGKIKIIFGEQKDYFENVQGKINTEIYNEIGKQILKDIYNLKDR